VLTPPCEYTKPENLFIRPTPMLSLLPTFKDPDGYTVCVWVQEGGRPCCAVGPSSNSSSSRNSSSSAASSATASPLQSAMT
jgi:hypothetical protein